MLVVGVERNREQTAGLPFEALLLPLVLPDTGRADAVEDVVQRFIDLALRIESFARRNADDISIVEISRTVEQNVHAVPAHAVPPFERNCVKIVDKESADHVDPLG